MYTYPTLDHLLDLPFDELLLVARLDRHSAAEHFGRTVRTIDNWRKAPPRNICRQLLSLAGYLEIHGQEWRGWRVCDGAIWTSSGVPVRAGEIHALPWLHAIASEQSRYWRKKVTEKTGAENVLGIPVRVNGRL